MRKYFGPAILTFFLVGAPLVSYLFLKSGYVIRKTAIEELEPKLLDPDISQVLYSHLANNGKAKLIYFPGSSTTEEISLLRAVDEKIVDRDRFEIVAFADSNLIQNSSISFVSLPDALGELPYSFILMDTAQIIRNSYTHNAEQAKKLFQHLAVIIPVPRSRELKLKREFNNED